ncbi:hypothetical protein [Sanguibacter suaedae]|uniref:Arylsulfatase n=1 Tax=Sanguibacter suaedae TaxID=2795737 RepID=A0A934M6M0_9MICO|nr:hypothetical protein [Sanguibacter suaedae]MBI9114402.1 hypothetical protein [Sanguibacter suaedae]
MHLAFLHTSHEHVASFAALAAEAPGVTKTSAVVDVALLGTARAGRADEAARGVAAHVADLARAGADVVVCTCSTLGPVLDGLTVPVPVPVPVVRVDRPMAEDAVRTPARGVAPGGLDVPGTTRVLVAVTLESAVGPALALLENAARDAGRSVRIDVVRCEAAWASFEAGDAAGYADAVAVAVREAAGRSKDEPVDGSGPSTGGPLDVVVLAQASMAPAADLLRDLGVPVLSSPRAAVRRAAEVALRGRDAPGVSG